MKKTICILSTAAMLMLSLNGCSGIYPTAEESTASAEPQPSATESALSAETTETTIISAVPEAVVVTTTETAPPMAEPAVPTTSENSTALNTPPASVNPFAALFAEQSSLSFADELYSAAEAAYHAVVAAHYLTWYGVN